MRALDLAHECGVTLSVEHHRLVARPADAITPGLRDAIRAHKSELLAHLSRDPEPSVSAPDTSVEPTGACPTCGSGQWWQPRGGGAWHCRHCDGDAMPLTASTLTLPCHAG